MSSAVSGPLAANTTNRIAQNKLKGGTLGGDYSQLEGILLPYDQLVQNGTLAPGQSYLGLSGNQSRLGRDIAGYEGDIASADPAFAAYQSAIAGGLNFDQNGLPADVSRQLLQGTRGQEASRGLLDSSTSAIQDEAALMGGSEQIRSNRLAQVNQYLSSPGGPGSAIASLFPGITPLYQGELQRALGGANAAVGAGNVGASAAGNSKAFGI